MKRVAASRRPLPVAALALMVPVFRAWLHGLARMVATFANIVAVFSRNVAFWSHMIAVSLHTVTAFGAHSRDFCAWSPPWRMLSRLWHMLGPRCTFFSMEKTSRKEKKLKRSRKQMSGKHELAWSQGQEM